MKSERRSAKCGSSVAPAFSIRPRKLVKVDFAKQLRKTWGSRVFGAAEVAEMRAAELKGEQE